MTITTDELERLRDLANMRGDPIRAPRSRHIGEYHSALVNAWERGELVMANERDALRAAADAMAAAICDWSRPTGANGMTMPRSDHPLMLALAAYHACQK